MTQLELGLELRDEGVARTDAVADPGWVSSVDQAISFLASTGVRFTVDDVRELGVADPLHPNQWGARFMAAARSGLIVKAGYQQSRTASRHAAVLTVWQGVL